MLNLKLFFIVILSCCCQLFNRETMAWNILTYKKTVRCHPWDFLVTIQAPGDANHLEHDFCFCSCWNFGSVALQCGGAVSLKQPEIQPDKTAKLIHVVSWRCFFRIHDHCNGYMKSIEILWLCVSCPGHWRADQTDLGVRVSCPRIFVLIDGGFFAHMCIMCARIRWVVHADGMNYTLQIQITRDVHDYMYILQWCRVILQPVCLQHA